MKTLMRKLIANKSHSYGTRQLVAGDEYEASRIHSRVLVAAKIARYAPEQPERSPLLVRAKREEAAPARPEAKPAPTPTGQDAETTVTLTKVPPRGETPQARPREPRR